MSGPISRIVRRSAGRQADSPVDAEATVDPAPAGSDPGEDAQRGPGARERGALRRRLRYLRRLRELQLRDLGGLVFDVHRFGEDADDAARARHAELVRAKVGDLTAADRELRAIERALGERHGADELREAGIGGTCDQCGALHASDARFCSSCGAPVAAGREPEGSGARLADPEGSSAADSARVADRREPDRRGSAAQPQPAQPAGRRTG
jgi:hypothetical protein